MADADDSCRADRLHGTKTRLLRAGTARWILGGALPFLLPTAAWSQSPSFEMAEGVRSAAEGWYSAVEWIALVVGVIVLLKAMRRLVDVAQDRRAGYASAIFMAAGAIGLIYLPLGFSSANETLFATDNVLAYAPASSDESTYLIAAVIRLVQLIGLIGFVRGWFFLTRAGRDTYQSDGMVARGLVFILGGTAAINIVLTAQVIASTLGVESPLNP